MDKNDNRSVVLISTTTLKEKCFIDTQLDDKSVRLASKTCQDMILEPLLGTQLYLELLTQAKNGKFLCDYKYIIENYLLYIVGYAVKAELLMDMTYKLKNKGVVTTNDVNVNTSSINDIKYLQQDIQYKIDNYSNRLVEYLDANKKKYPEYGVIKSREEDRGGQATQSCPLFLKKIRK